MRFTVRPTRVTHRPRRHLPRPIVTILGATLFRWSENRRAYILRVVGRQYGPVIRGS
jgi:hypothetical protein